MNKSLKTLVLGVIATAFVAIGAISAPANALSPLTVTVSKTTNLALAGETVSVSVSGIPTNQGIYVYQCASAGVSPRPDATKCRSGMSESLWLTTNGGMGAGVASQANQLSVVKEFTIGSTTFDCSVDACGIFVRRDHMGGSSDFSLDTLIPISFATLTPAPKAIQKVPAIGTKVKVGKAISFKKKTSAGLLMVAKNSTPKICSVVVKGANFKVTGKKAGTCKITLSQSGNETNSPLKATVKNIKVS